MGQSHGAVMRGAASPVVMSPASLASVLRQTLGMVYYCVFSNMWAIEETLVLTSPMTRVDWSHKAVGIHL
jgi:hypothetical protein